MNAAAILKHWRGSQAENGLEAAPMLEFDNVVHDPPQHAAAPRQSPN